ncbi:MAG: electron transfer flavoprotein subunit beta/FixA family protein, partial [Dongiaceae bacterium]
VETQNVKMSINPFDEIAVEEAIRLKEKSLAKEVIAVSIGPAQVQETLRHSLALGADRAIHITSDQELSPLQIAKILQKIIMEESPALVIMGKQAIDDDSNQTGQMLAALLDWPQATFASKLTVNGNNAEVMREIDGGLETLALELPAIITTDLRLNTPRFASLPNIMKAKSKPLATKPVAEYGLDLKPQVKTIKVLEPAKRQGGIKVADVPELVQRLSDAGVLP